MRHSRSHDSSDIGVFEDAGEKLNPNLMAEVGAPMLMAGRRCAHLRDRTAPPMPTDLIGSDCPHRIPHRLGAAWLRGKPLAF